LFTRHGPTGRPSGGPSVASAGIAVVVAVLAVFGLRPALVDGHGGSPGLIAEPNPVNPGGTIEIRGDNLGSDEPVQLFLVDGGRSIVLGSGTTDGEGHLALFAILPADIAAGAYTVRAQSDGGYIAAGTLELAGPPIVAGPEGNPLERGPIGGVPPAVAPSTKVAGSGSAPAVPSGQPTAFSDALILVVSLLIPVAVVMGMIGWRRRVVGQR
jgi:hypothetical protein